MPRINSLTKVVAILLAITMMAGCDKLGLNTNNEDKISLTFNLTGPTYQNVSGKGVMATLWRNWGDNVAYKSAQAVFSGNYATVTVSDIAPGNYHLLVTIDAAGNGFAGSPVEQNDLFWGALDVQLSQNKTITLSSYHWQHYHSLVFGIRGVPAGHDGKICALGIFTPDYNISNPELEAVCGGAAVIYNSTALVAMNPSEGQGSNWSLPNGTYDVWMLVDVDGEVSNWADSNGVGNPITGGDYIDSIPDWTYNSSTMDNWQLINANFVVLQGITLTVNMTLPSGYSLDGHEVAVGLFSSFEGGEPAYLVQGTVTGNTATRTVNLAWPGTYHVAALVDVDGNGIVHPDEGPLNRGDLAWCGLSVPITSNMEINIPADAWQRYNLLNFAIGGLPSGYNGKPLAMAVTYNDGNIFGHYWDHLVLVGVAKIYNNSAFICTGPADDPQDTTFYLSTNDYDAWFLIDADGSMAYYQNPGHWPVTVNDRYFVYDFRFNADSLSQDHLTFIPSATFSPVVGVSGTVSCPSWNPGQGLIYLFLFSSNPLQNPNAEALALISLTTPGGYSIPYMTNTSGYVVGFWDADNSGEENGPTQNDMCGGYGPSLDLLELVNLGQFGAAGIDFELNVPFDSSLYGGGGN